MRAQLIAALLTVIAEVTSCTGFQSNTISSFEMCNFGTSLVYYSRRFMPENLSVIRLGSTLRSRDPHHRAFDMKVADVSMRIKVHLIGLTGDRGCTRSTHIRTTDT